MSLAYLILPAITTRQRLCRCVIIEKRPIWLHCSYFVTSVSPKQLKLDIMHLEEIFSLIEVVPPPPHFPVVLKSVLVLLCLSLRLHAGSRLFLFNVSYEMRFWSYCRIVSLLQRRVPITVATKSSFIVCLLRASTQMVTATCACSSSASGPSRRTWPSAVMLWNASCWLMGGGLGNVSFLGDLHTSSHGKCLSDSN